MRRPRPELLAVASTALILPLACGPVSESAARSREAGVAPGNEIADRRASLDSIIVPGVRIGQVSAMTSEQDLIRLYGRGAVRRGDIYIAEGESEPGTILFGGSAAELEIVWTDADARCPRYIVVRAPKSPWRTAGGVAIGSPLRDVVQENGRAFTFSGFDWDYQGFVTDWRGGSLEGLTARFRWPEGTTVNIHPDSLERLGGDVRLSSDDPLITELQPTIYQLGMGWNPDDPAVAARPVASSGRP